jgi:hypothetical protein
MLFEWENIMKTMDLTMDWDAPAKVAFPPESSYIKKKWWNLSLLRWNLGAMRAT